MKRLSRILIISMLFTILIGLNTAIAQEQVSSVKINSILVDRSEGFDHIKFLIKGRKSGNFEPILDQRKAVQKTLEYFFIGLAMNEDSFWVNLNPYKSDRIIDPRLGDTDLGRIMLNADLRLKEDVTTLINPQLSETGREFWQRLYAKAQELGLNEIPVITKVCIVPAEVTAYETGNQFSIIKSTLRVRLEDPGSFSNKEDKRHQELEKFSYSLMEELILPELNKKVNESYGYADLREVYNALILARWYKENLSYSNDPLLRSVNLGVLKEAADDYSSSTEEIYQDYLKSFKGGEYSFSENDSFGAGVSIKHYFSGGVDFKNIRIVRINSQPQTDVNDTFFTCDLLIPQGILQPLEYARNQIDLTLGNSLQDKSPAALVKSFPAISPISFTGQNMQDLNSIDRTERTLLSKL